MKRRSRRSGRTFEGTLAFLAVCMLAACVLPMIVATDRSAPTDVAGVTSLALTQELPPAPDLTSARQVDTGAWVSRTTARAEGDLIVVATRPASWVQLVLAPLLALASIALAFVFVWEQTHGWRPGGAPKPPGRVGLLARVTLVSLVNPLGLGAIALWTLERRVEVGHERVVLRPPAGASHAIVGVEAGAWVPLSDGRGRVVLVRRPAEGELAPIAEGVLTLASGEAGLARALIEAATR